MEGGQAEMWGRVDNLLLIHKSLQRVNEESPDGRKNNKKSETLGGWVLVWGPGVQESGAAVFFSFQNLFRPLLLQKLFWEEKEVGRSNVCPDQENFGKALSFFPRENDLFRRCSIGQYVFRCQELHFEPSYLKQQKESMVSVPKEVQ